MGTFFKWWAKKLIKCTCPIFVVSLILFFVLSLNCINYESYPNQETVWTPIGNASIKNKEKAKLLYSEPLPENLTAEEQEEYDKEQEEGSDERKNFRVVMFILEAKRPNYTAWDTLLTLEAMQAMVDFEEKLYSVKLPYDFALDGVILNNMTNELGEPYSGPAELGMYDLCKKYNRTTEEDDEDLEEDCNPEKPYDCPVKMEPICFTKQHPLDFVYERWNDTYNISRYDSDKELVDKIKTGKGDPYLYKRGRSLYIDQIFGGTQPKKVDQNYLTGKNDLEYAKAASLMYLLDTKDNNVSRNWMTEWEKLLEAEMTQYSDENRLITFQIFTIGGFVDIFTADFLADAILLGVSICTVQLYCYAMLGNCSPIHCRCVQASIGFICVTLSIAAGGGICFYIGQLMTSVHNILPFMLLGIGVDDMFVIVNTIDQVPDHLSPEKRFIVGLAHAGPSITITSFTNALAFFFGGFTSLAALNSFCFFACIQVICLYITVLTIFSAAMVWDLRRMHNRRGDCCGCCKCSEDSWLFCCGKFLSPKQQKFSGIYKPPKKSKQQDLGAQISPIDLNSEEFAEKKLNDRRASFDGSGSIRRSQSRNMSTKGFINEDEYSSAVEKFLATVFAPELTSFEGRASILTIWFMLCVVAIHGCMNVTIDFKFEFFIPPGSTPEKYFTLDAVYFSSGTTTTIYIENDEPFLDYSKPETQLRLLDFYDKIQRNYLCDESWFERDTLSSWYTEFFRWVSRGECFLEREGLDPFEKIIDPDIFYVCLNEYLLTDTGEGQLDGMRFTDEANPMDRRILGFKTRLGIKKIDTAAFQGVQLLYDIRMLEQTYGLPNTFSFAQQYLDYEQYILFVQETSTSLTLSIVACLIVILIITASAQATMLVALCVFLVDVFLAALIFYWGLTFNPLVVINIVIAIGLSVDYSAHISHSYLITNIPKELKGYYNTKEKIRVYKAQQALSKMGSSVFHGGFSTFLAIVTLSPSRTYIFVVFFRLWFGIILFGLSNGFMLLPVILSIIGETDDVVDNTLFEASESEDEMPLNQVVDDDNVDAVFKKIQPRQTDEDAELEMAVMNQMHHDFDKDNQLLGDDGPTPALGQPINQSNSKKESNPEGMFPSIKESRGSIDLL